MSRRDPGCAVWDSYLGECREWRLAAWWEYVNVASIAAVVGVLLLALVVLALVGTRIGKGKR
jgi:hypothetical protein